MTIKKQPSGHWLCEVYPWGREGRRIRKKFTTKSEALAFENHVKNEAIEKPWLANEKKDNRRLSELISLWYNAHGVTLNTGDEMLRTMQFACDFFNNPIATNFTAKDYTDYREKRLNGSIYRRDQVQNVSLRTLNKELKTFKSMFNELSRLGEWDRENPLKNIREFKQQESEMAFLTTEQISALLSACEQSRKADLLIIIKIALSTGARWSEVASLTRSQISKYRITYINTKGKKNRTIPITKELYDEIMLISNKSKESLFSDCYTAFRRALKRANIDLPKGQLSHVLRHSFASHFMMKGGNILVLQRILGHSNITMTMRYAHFAPDHLEDAIKLNPLSN